MPPPPPSWRRSRFGSPEVTFACGRRRERNLLLRWAQKAPDRRRSGAWQTCLPLDSDAQIQVDVLGCQAVLEVLCEARVAGGVRAFGDCTAEFGQGVR